MDDIKLSKRREFTPTMEGWHQFDIKVSPHDTFDVTPMTEWCNMNCMGKWSHAPLFSRYIHAFYFKSKHDWAMFKLVWDRD